MNGEGDRKAFGLPQTKRSGNRSLKRMLKVAARMDVAESTSGTIFYSDRGSHYASEDFRNILKVFGMRASMSRKAECWIMHVSRASLIR